jgi:FAD synthetase
VAPGKIVLATGVFDILHPGHIKFLEESKKAGGPRAKLIVVVARDKTVLKRKGRRPVLPESDRRQIVAALKPVAQAFLGHEDVDFLTTLRELQPEVVCVGYDQNDIKVSVGRIVKAQHLPIRIVQLPKYGIDGLNSSTGVKRRVVKGWPKIKPSS